MHNARHNLVRAIDFSFQNTSSRTSVNAVVIGPTMFMNCPKCGETCPEGLIQCAKCTPLLTPEKLVATWECVVTETDGDIVYCDAYPLDGTPTDDREFWEVKVPGNKWTEGHAFYVLRSR